MQRVRIAELLNEGTPGQTVTVAGWVRTRRDAKGFSFVEVNDGSCLATLQTVVDHATPGADVLERVSTGASVRVQGEVVESPGKGQRIELRATELTLLGEADVESYPLQKKRHSDEFLRTIAHLRPRTNKYGALTRIRSEASFAVHEFFRAEGFHHIHAPVITGSDCEGAGEMFRVEAEPAPPAESGGFFGQPAYLTVSGQLSAEALACGMGSVYTFGPTFRAENSHTARHAAEFWMVEPEMAFADLTDDMDLAERFLQHMITSVCERCAEDVELFAKWVDKGLDATLDAITGNDFARLSYTEAMAVLEKSGRSFEYPVGFGHDLQTEHERYLTEEYAKRPVFVYDWPREIKAFYMRANDDGHTVAAMDLLVPRVGELFGGSQREERYDVLTKRIAEMNLDATCYGWYLDLRRYGTVPHAGFGMGFERFLMMVTGVSNIRDVIAFARTPGSLAF